MSFWISQEPVYGRRCDEITIRNKDNTVLRTFKNPSSDIFWTTTAPSTDDTFYVVKFVFSERGQAGTYSHVWANPVFVDVLGAGVSAAQADVVLAFDSTGSMEDNLATAKQTAVSLVGSLEGSDFRVGVVDYKDFAESPGADPGDYPYRVILPFTDDKEAIISAIEEITVGGGGDERESVYTALMNALDASTLGGWREIKNKLIVLIGDAAPHDPEPFTGYTLDSVVAAAEAVDPASIFSLALGGNSTTYDYFSRLSEMTGGAMFTEETAELLPEAVLAKINETTAPAILEATLDIDPNTLNLESNGRWITAYIELPEGYDVSKIDIPSLRLNGLIFAEPFPTEIGDYDTDGITDLMVKFDRAAVQDLLSPGDQLLIVTGIVEDQIFIGKDMIRAIMPARERDPNHPE